MFDPSDPLFSGEPPTDDRRLPLSGLPPERDSGYEASPANFTTDQQQFFGGDDDVFEEAPTEQQQQHCRCACHCLPPTLPCDSEPPTTSSSSARPASLPIGIPRSVQTMRMDSTVCSCSPPPEDSRGGMSSPRFFHGHLRALASQPRSWPTSIMSWWRRCSPSEIVMPNIVSCEGQRRSLVPLRRRQCPVHGPEDDRGQSSSSGGRRRQRRCRTLNESDLDSLSTSSADSILSLHEDTEENVHRAEPLPDLVLQSSPRRNRSVSVSLPIESDPWALVGRSLRRLSDQFEADRSGPSLGRRATMDNTFRRSP